MVCPNCHHENEGGKFCERCGTGLVHSAANETAAGTEAAAIHPSAEQASVSQQNQYIETTKKFSKMYFSFFLQILKNPYANSQRVGKEQLVNGIITMALYSFLIPLMIYFGLKGLLSDMSGFGSELMGDEMNIQPPFTDIVLKPAFAYFIFILLIATFTFAAVKLGRINTAITDVFARFGSFLIPVVAVLAVGVIMSFLKIKLFIAVLLIGFIGSTFIIPSLIITSFKKGSGEGVDTIYGSLITMVLAFIAIAIMGDMLFESLKSAFEDLFGFGVFSDF
ncbi:zinc ribbon domain-containing protein [Metabacillus indicus]|uniref:zinc ribbon domain-containing protein n=1 Tax=Metabacillus indicus TaxID=246786 RepID=UPI003CEAB3FD